MAREGDGAPKALPVIFHQCLLVFAQRYRNDSKFCLMTPKIVLSILINIPVVTEDQREALLDLLLTHGHEKIAPEIRKELLAGRGRGIPVQQLQPTFDGDDTMLVDS